MPTKGLDVTLANAAPISDYLSTWLKALALDPDQVAIRIMDRSDDGLVLELCYRDGESHGGLVFDSAGGAIHARAAVETSRPLKIKHRSASEMREACRLAHVRATYAGKCVRAVQYFVYCLLPVAAIVGALYLLQYLLS